MRKILLSIRSNVKLTSTNLFLYNFSQAAEEAEKLRKAAEETERERRLNPQKRHVMISYHPEDCSDVAEAIYGMLIEKYDVWMDKRGSSTLPFATGNGFDRALHFQAVELSEFMIVLVSKKYGRCENCEQVAKHAFQIKNTLKELQVMYVMTDEDLTVFPEYVSGWLGILLGDDKYYKCFDPIGRSYLEGNVENDAAKVLSELMGEMKQDQLSKAIFSINA